MVRLFALPILLSAALLFGVQPLFARMALPLLGGAPAVWNTAMLFFQAVLLLGYLYAHLLTGRVAPRWQAPIHLAVLLAAGMALPLALPDGWTPPGDGFPAGWLLGLMAVSVGLPFFAVSTTSPLLQHWFAGTGRDGSRDPYFLYAASNLGSLGALLAYPLVIEPLLTLATQSMIWTAGYALLVALVAAAAWPGRRGTEDNRFSAPRSAKVWLRWLIWAAIPSSLMLSVTQYLTTDIASAPLLWLPPLALYLLSFVNSFARRPWIGFSFLARAVPVATVVLALLLASQVTEPKVLLMAAHLAAFFLIACLCHGRLAADRPPARELTGFYLALSAGGVIGGAFTALLAPLLFSTVLEYPIVLVAALPFIPVRSEKISAARKSDPWWPVATVLLAAAAFVGEPFLGETSLALLLAPAALACFVASRRPRLFTIAMALFFVVSLIGKRIADRTLETRRSFFGVYRVVRDLPSDTVMLLHGTTLHGSQSESPDQRGLATSYYHPAGPCGEIVQKLQTSRGLRRIGTIGLGVGTMAAYGREDEQWDFFEIDPVSAYFARDSGHFTYLKECRAAWRIVLGDGRLNLAREPDGAYNLLVVDAFSSDAIPVHLITREALAAYFEKLTPDGVLLFHISNNHLELRPVLAAAAKELGVSCRARFQTVEKDDAATGAARSSLWAVLARDESRLSEIVSAPDWAAPEAPDGFRVWTDDYASLLSVWKGR